MVNLDSFKDPLQPFIRTNEGSRDAPPEAVKPSKSEKLMPANKPEISHREMLNEDIQIATSERKPQAV